MQNKLFLTPCRTISFLPVPIKFSIRRTLLIIALILIILIIFVRLYSYNKQYEIVGWESHKSRNILSYLPDNPNTFHILPKSFCNSRKFLVFFIATTPTNFKKRQIIRNTWARKNDTSDLIAVYFLIGTINDDKVQEKLLKESDKYNDIVQENFVDHYNNLTLKSVTILKVAKHYCANNTKFIFKTDDDVFVNTGLLLQYLKENENNADFLSGHLLDNSPAIRDPSDKWYCPYYMYECDIFPKYLAGSGYVMTSNVATALYKATFNTPLMHIEDIYVTGLCARKANISHVGDQRFTTHYFYNDCQTRKLFSRHLRKPEDMYKLDKVVRRKLDKSCPP